MRALIAAVVILVIGCGGDDVEVEPDAGSVDAVHVDARVAVDAEPMGLEGAWRVTWACVDACGSFPAEPALVYSDMLTVTGAGLWWHDSDCTECERNHEGQAAGELCLDVAAGVEGNHDRAPYRICDVGGAAEATITWTPRFGTPTPTTWTATGVR